MTVNLNYVRAITREMKEGWKARRKGRGDKEKRGSVIIVVRP